VRKTILLKTSRLFLIQSQCYEELMCMEECDIGAHGLKKSICICYYIIEFILYFADCAKACRGFRCPLLTLAIPCSCGGLAVLGSNETCWNYDCTSNGGLGPFAKYSCPIVCPLNALRWISRISLGRLDVGDFIQAEWTPW
jgi:hypothetical protein